MTLLFCSSNEGKFLEVRQVLKEKGVVVEHFKMELVEPKVFSLEEVVLSKARQAFNAAGGSVVVEDTGIFFLDYNDFPGAFTKVFVSSVGLKGVLRLVEGTSRKAVFKTFLAYKDANIEKVFVGSVSGSISREIKGSSHTKLPFDSVFIPDGWNKTFAEGTSEEKNIASHRAKVVREFAVWFKDYSTRLFLSDGK
ncbi:non-canonical purine NTP pyrophosphatase [Candidatus Micrarchaeota archaeon]|nr:non-canonical purine NTP pyrophosphatase [Candidatus Micrarchaeota archaeon]